ncbi:LysR substrate binding domain protein [Limosilactobacillus frumenti DSM 13145]|uniref:LysR substrate binding domain protein n=1 Tax=Limosilactobacillus frumenti DSM 13145 TaxID=1423746 RepID=A0A0R1P3K8_9LACO|nr:LysR family transcriptional regulator [Limosilactobacillus frumenti]KRL27089.1 LysR substrate binding domain protein [Limosilactobacillus frumenti DSM 13145]MBA2913779.1 LysR family transcriptional regulator [Limosilactobacillus frumenti]QFG72561.1 LysR family transcriptional regulator [Limosilactobacillus frumenti]
METRVLKYFLTVARTNNITKAARKLHITQPTLSRQIMDLEQELGVTLFDRQNRHLQLTKQGALFQQKAMLLLSLLDQTKQELQQSGHDLVGTVNLGCVVSNASSYIMKKVAAFQERYPDVQFNIYDGNGDLLKQRLDTGLENLVVLIQPIEAAKYNYVIMPIKERWGVFMRRDLPFANKKHITKTDLYQVPLILPVRNIVRDDVSEVLGLDQRKLTVKATNNLPNNALELLRTGKYYGIGIQGVNQFYNDPQIKFVPFAPAKETGHVIAWRKNIPLSPAATRFLQFLTENDRESVSNK